MSSAGVSIQPTWMAFTRMRLCITARQVAPAQHDAGGPTRREQPRNRLAQSLAAAGDDRVAALQGIFTHGNGYHIRGTGPRSKRQKHRVWLNLLPTVKRRARRWPLAAGQNGSARLGAPLQCGVPQPGQPARR